LAVKTLESKPGASATGDTRPSLTLRALIESHLLADALGSVQNIPPLALIQGRAL